MVLENYIDNEYLRAFVVFLVSFILLKIAFTILEKILVKATMKTKTDVDDILVKKTSKPMYFFIFLISLRITIAQLTLVESTESFLVRLVSSFSVIIIAYLVYAVVDIILVRGIKKFANKTKSTLDDTLVSLVHGALTATLFVISSLYVLSIWGVEIVPLLGALGVAGIAIALALQPALSNIFSGASIILDKSIRVGDLVYLDANTKGKVEKIGMRSTKIRTFDNEWIIVPNTKLAESVIQNVALPEPKSRAVVPFSVAYGSKIEKVKDLIIKELKKIEHVMDDPEPNVRFIEMANSSLNFKAYFYVNSFENRFGAIDEANTRIYNALNKARISIPFPQMDVHLKRK